MLCVREVESGINLVKDIHRRGLKLQKRHDKGESDQRSIETLSFLESRSDNWNDSPLATAQLSQTLFPHTTKLDFNFQSLSKILTVRWLEFSEISRK